MRDTRQTRPFFVCNYCLCTSVLSAGVLGVSLILSSRPATIFVVTGPSGVGKGTLCALLIERQPTLHLSISATSRQPRPGEVDGVSYYFKTPEAFQAMIAHDAAESNPERHTLLEWAVYNDNYYGTPLAPLHAALAVGQHVILEIETQGALQVRQKFPDACLIFIAPPSLEILEARLRGRGTETEAAVENRIAIARHELTLQDQFDQVVVNDDLEACYQTLAHLITD